MYLPAFLRGRLSGNRKIKKQMKYIFTIIFLGLVTIYSFAQEYTLQDEDVTVVNGVITNCTYDFAIKNIKIPETLDSQTIIGINDSGYENGIFYNKGLERVILPNTLENIGDYAFTNNYFLDSVYFPSNLKRIGRSAFEHSALKTIVFPNSVEQIEANAFAHSFYLSEISFPVNPLFTVLDGGVFYDCDLSNVVIPNTINIIEYGAFYGNDQLDSIMLPSPDISGQQGWIDNSGNIFASGSYVDNLNTSYYLVTPYTLKDEDVEVDENGHIQTCYLDDLFLKGKILTIPENLAGKTIKGIGDFEDNLTTAVFYYKELAGVVLPSTLKHIGRFAFYNNILTSLTIPAKVEYIDDGAFKQNLIQKLNFESNNVLLSIGQLAFSLNRIESISLPTSLTYLGNGAFNANDITKINDNETDGLFYSRFSNSTIIDSSTIVSFGSRYAKNLDFIPKNVKHLNPYSFSSSKIDSVRIPSGIKTIGRYSFMDISTDTIVFPTSLEYIGSNAFSKYTMDSIFLPQIIKEGYQFDYWVNDKDSVVNYITDFSSDYKAICTENGFKISGSFSEFISYVTFHITGDFEDYLYFSWLRDYSFRVNSGRNLIITPYATGYDFYPKYYSVDNITSDIVELDFSVATVGINEHKTYNELLCHPNPAKDFVIVNHPTAKIFHTINLCDVYGRSQVVPVKSGISEVRLDINHLPPGIYFVCYEDIDGEVYFSKLLKE